MGKKRNATERVAEDDEAALDEELAEEDLLERHALAADLDNGLKGKDTIDDQAGITRCLNLVMDDSAPFLETLVLDYAAPLEAASDDDLEREVAIYNATLTAVREGRRRLVEEHGEPFERPEDFFCEMMKSDTHMARVKDELIFQQKKMEAFEKRKERQHQLKFNKAVKAEKVASQAAKKKDALEEAVAFRKQAAVRGKSLETGRPARKSRKREAKDRRWGFGGRKRGLKRNDAKSINDMSDFHPTRGKTKRKAPQSPPRKRKKR